MKKILEEVKNGNYSHISSLDEEDDRLHNVNLLGLTKLKKFNDKICFSFIKIYEKLL